MTVTFVCDGVSAAVPHAAGLLEFVDTLLDVAAETGNATLSFDPAHLVLPHADIFWNVVYGDAPPLTAAMLRAWEQPLDYLQASRAVYVKMLGALRAEDLGFGDAVYCSQFDAALEIALRTPLDCAPLFAGTEDPWAVIDTLAAIEAAAGQVLQWPADMPVFGNLARGSVVVPAGVWLQAGDRYAAVPPMFRVPVDLVAGPSSFWHVPEVTALPPLGFIAGGFPCRLGRILLGQNVEAVPEPFSDIDIWGVDANWAASLYPGEALAVSRDAIATTVQIGGPGSAHVLSLLTGPVALAVDAGFPPEATTAQFDYVHCQGVIMSGCRFVATASALVAWSTGCTRRQRYYGVNREVTASALAREHKVARVLGFQVVNSLGAPSADMAAAYADKLARKAAGLWNDVAPHVIENYLSEAWEQGKVYGCDFGHKLQRMALHAGVRLPGIAAPFPLDPVITRFAAVHCRSTELRVWLQPHELEAWLAVEALFRPAIGAAQCCFVEHDDCTTLVFKCLPPMDGWVYDMPALRAEVVYDGERKTLDLGYSMAIKWHGFTDAGDEGNRLYPIAVEMLDVVPQTEPLFFPRA